MAYKFIFLTFVLLLIAACKPIGLSLEATSDQINSLNSIEVEDALDRRVVDYSGTYAIANGGRCTLKTVHDLLKAPFQEIEIELACNRGAPSYNSGYVLATARIAENVAVFSPDFPNDNGDECFLIFAFGEAKVNITQIGLDYECGFGGSVYANGTYQLIDDSKPILGCMRGDNPCNLDVSP